jgi:glycosyltransferase involved in cell wall biosynthesis
MFLGSAVLIKVAVVSDRNSYALQLTGALSRLPNVHCVFYGPKGLLLGKTVRFGGFKNDRAVWTTYGYVLQILSQALRDRPQIIHIDFTLTEFGSSYLSCLPLPFLVILLRLFGIKMVVSVHDTITKNVLREFFGGSHVKWPVAWIVSVIFYKFLSCANVLIVHLKVQKQMLATMCYVNPKKLVVVPFGVEETPLVSDARLNFWRDKFRNKIVFFFGAIAPRKGIEYLIEAFSIIADKHPDSTLVVAGPPDSKNKWYLDDLLRKANQLRDDASFAYLGPLRGDDAHCLLKLSRVVVLPYVYSYATNSILYWVIQHHKPVIASRLATLQEELEGYTETLMVRPRDSMQIAWALEKILNDDNLVAEVSRFMAAKASSISWRNVIESIHKIYLEQVDFHA